MPPGSAAAGRAMRTSRALLEVLINTVTHRRCPLAPLLTNSQGYTGWPPPTHARHSSRSWKTPDGGSSGAGARGTKGCASGSTARTGSQTGAPSTTSAGSQHSAVAARMAAAAQTPFQHRHGAADAEEVRGHPLGWGWAPCPWLCIPRDITAPARRAAVEQGQAAEGTGGGPCTQPAAWSHGAHTAPVCAELLARVCGCGTAVHPLLLAACPLSVHNHACLLHPLHAQTCKLAACSVCTRVLRGPWDTCGVEGGCRRFG